MSLPRYERYKDSGVEWLGDVPDGWEVYAVKRFSSFVYGDSLPSEIRNGNGVVSVYGSNGSFGQHDQPNTAAPVILIGRKGSCGALNWSELPVFAIDTVYFVDSRHCKGDLRWLFWALHTARLDTASQDTGVPGLSREFAYNIKLPYPPLPEQLTIAAFLDRETGKIDAMIQAVVGQGVGQSADGNSLVGLLKERRSALISAAVTGKIDVRGWVS